LPRKETDVPQTPLVTVIVPVFNKADFFRNCLLSIQSQSHKNIEVICVDDQSTDNSLDIANEFALRDSRFKVLAQLLRHGASAARNAGLDHARGEFILFVDADDWIEPNAVDLLLKLYTKTDADLVRGSIAIHTNDEVVSDIGWQRVIDGLGPPFPQQKNIPGYIWGFTAFLYRKSFLEAHSLRFPVELARGEDPVFLCRSLLAARTVATSSEIVYNYRKIHGRKLTDEIPAFDSAFQLARQLEMIRDALIESGNARQWHETQMPLGLRDMWINVGQQTSLTNRVHVLARFRPVFGGSMTRGALSAHCSGPIWVLYAAAVYGFREAPRRLFGIAIVKTFKLGRLMRRVLSDNT
jgi:hypothetical protein